MPTLIIVLTILLYLGAALMWFREGSYRYLATLVLSHLTALLDPLWQRLYGYSYAGSSAAAVTLLDRPVPTYILIGSAWFYALPALALFYAYRQRWWPRHYIMGIVAFLAMLLYHLLGEGLAVRAGLWSFAFTSIGPVALPYVLFMATIGALVSLLTLYLLISTRHFAWEMLLPVLAAGLLAAPLLAYGVLGVPFWLAQLLSQPDWVIALGVLVTLCLLGWVVHLSCWGLHASRVHPVRWG